MYKHFFSIKKIALILFFLLLVPSVALLKNHYNKKSVSNESVFAASTSQFVVKDQESTCALTQTFTEARNSIWKGQTIVAGRTGNLYRVKLEGVNNGGNSTLHLRQIINGIPTGSDLGIATITCGNVFEFNPPIHINEDQQYGLLLSNDGSGFSWQYSNSDTCYPNTNGHPLTSLDNGQMWSTDLVDFYFSTYVIPDSQTGTPITPPSVCVPAPTPGPAVTKANVFVISLPGGTPLSSIESMTNDVILNLKKGMMYHGYTNPTIQPYLEYQIYDGKVNYETEMPPKLSNNNYDINSLYQKYNLCSLIQNNLVDEVWFWDSGQGGLPEWVTTGPNWPTDSVNNTPNCGRQISTLAFNNGRSIGSALHSYGHRLEGLYRKYFPCDFAPEWEPGCTSPTGTASGFVTTFAKNSTATIAGCGDIHFPPNIVSGGDYQYSSTSQEPSICSSWAIDGSSTIKNIDCTEWGCTEFGYMIWWMQNIPGMNNVNKNRNGVLQPNWWTYLFTASPSPSPSPTPSPTPVPPTPSPTPLPVTTSFQSIEDSYVNSGNKLRNYGTATNLRINQTANDAYQSYIKFNLTGLSGKVISAKLRLYPYDGSTKASYVYATTNTWTEKTVTWNTAPALGQKLATLPSLIKNTWAGYDVTSAIATNGTYSFIVTNSANDNVYFYSRDHNTLKPELVVITQ